MYPRPEILLFQVAFNEVAYENLFVNKGRPRLVQFGVRVLIGRHQTLQFSVFGNRSPLPDNCVAVFLFQAEIGTQLFSSQDLLRIFVVAYVDACE